MSDEVSDDSSAGTERTHLHEDAKEILVKLYHSGMTFVDISTELTYQGVLLVRLSEDVKSKTQ